MEVSTSKSFILLLLAIVSFISQTKAAKDSRPAYTNFIKTKCNIARYPSLCRKTLMPYASSVKINSITLCKRSLKITLKGARNAFVIVLTLKIQKGISGYEAMSIKDCIETVNTAMHQLKRTIKAIGHVGDNEEKNSLELINAMMYASAALTNAGTCTDGFSEHKLNPNVKKVIDRSMTVVITLGRNALTLVDNLDP